MCFFAKCPSHFIQSKEIASMDVGHHDIERNQKKRVRVHELHHLLVTISSRELIALHVEYGGGKIIVTLIVHYLL